MYWRFEYVRENVAMTLGGTYKLDLPKHGQLCGLFFRLSGTDVSGLGATGGKWRLIDYISKIAVIGDGATVIKSLTGYQVQGLAYLDQGVLPQGSWRNYAANTQLEHMLINFGHYLYDPDFGLNLERFNNVELQIDNNATAGGATNLADLTVSVLAIYKEEGGVYPAYFRTEEWRAWTTVQAQTVYNDLPLEGKLRRVVLQAIPGLDGSNLENTNMSNLMYDIEFLMDTGRTRVLKGGINDIMRLNHLDIGKPVIVGGTIYQNADVGVDMSLGYIYGRANGAGSLSGAVATTFSTIEASRTSFTQKFESHNADNPHELLVLGLAPYEMLSLPFINPFDPGNFIDLRSRATVALNITTRDSSSAASGRNAIILDRLIV
jgi:hypothetical protein